LYLFTACKKYTLPPFAAALQRSGGSHAACAEPLSRNNAAMCRFFHTPFFPVLVKKQAAQGVPQESKAKA